VIGMNSSDTPRLATPRDLPEVVRIYNQTIDSRMATADLEPVSIESRRAWFDEHTAERHPLWVSERDGRVVGWAGVQPFHARAAYHATAELSVYVDAAARRAGVGRQLVAHAIAEAPALELHTLIGLVFGHNAPSLALLSALGFQRWGVLPRVAELDATERDLVFLGLRVG
jgi:L-amino acid N-acyltransferase YncA